MFPEAFDRGTVMFSAWAIFHHSPSSQQPASQYAASPGSQRRSDSTSSSSRQALRIASKSTARSHTVKERENHLKPTFSDHHYTLGEYILFTGLFQRANTWSTPVRQHLAITARRGHPQRKDHRRPRIRGTNIRRTQWRERVKGLGRSQATRGRVTAAKMVVRMAAEQEILNSSPFQSFRTLDLRRCTAPR